MAPLPQEKYPERWLPKFGYMPYIVVWAAAPLVGMGRDFIECAQTGCLTYNLTVLRLRPARFPMRALSSGNDLP